MEGAREVVAEAFDITVEVARAIDEGRLRVVRVAELAGVEAEGIVCAISS